MKNNFNFGFWEMVFIISNSICFKLFLLFTTICVKSGGTATILLTFLSLGVALLFFLLIAKLYGEGNRKSILKIAEEKYGKTGLILTTLSFILFCIFSASVNLRQIIEAMMTISLPTSPYIFVSFFFIIAMAFGAFMGIKSIVRSHVIFFPLIAISVLIVILTASGSYNIRNIFPLLGFGLKGIPNFFLFSLFFLDFLILLLFMPYTKKDVSFKKVGVTSILISGAFAVVINGVYLLSVAYPSNTEYFLPIFQIERFMSFGRGSIRLGSILTILWSMSFFLYLSLNLYIICSLFAKIFGFKSARPAVIPFSFIIFIGSLVPYNIFQLFEAIKIASLSRILFGLIPSIFLLAVKRKELK